MADKKAPPTTDTSEWARTLLAIAGGADRVTPQVLTVQLRRLEADGVVARAMYPEIHVRVKNALTTSGAATVTPRE